MIEAALLFLLGWWLIGAVIVLREMLLAARFHPRMIPLAFFHGVVAPLGIARWRQAALPPLRSKSHE